jgi:enolase
MTLTEITGVDAWEVLDSRGRPTVSCAVTLADGSTGAVAVPSGASTGRHEATELRDGGKRYGGLGVRTAVGHVRGELAAAAVGRAADDQRALDDALRAADGTPTLSRLGANAVLAMSLAAAHAVAASRRQPLWQVVGAEPLIPLPMVNVVSGGAHAAGMIDVQDFLVVPVGASHFAEAIEWAARVRACTAAAAAERGLAASLVADEGGIAGRLPTNRDALELLADGVRRSGLALGGDVAFALDVAATQLLAGDGRYHLRAENRVLTARELVDEIAGWCADFPIVSVEDVVGEDDWAGWEYATHALPGVQLLGDDLFVTQLDRLDRGISEGIANAVLVKVNQNGTLTGAMDVVARAREMRYATVFSARSGETEDSWLADVAVGSRAGQIKVGSTVRSERTAKWNRLLEIEHRLGDAATYAGAGALARLR